MDDFSKAFLKSIEYTALSYGIYKIARKVPATVRYYRVKRIEQKLNELDMDYNVRHRISLEEYYVQNVELFGELIHIARKCNIDIAPYVTKWFPKTEL